MSNFGKERIILVQLDQPLCVRDYGDAFKSPTGGCQAQLGVTGTRKCYNTRGTCQDEARYSPGTLTLQFAKDQPGLRQYGYVIPSVVSISVASAGINLGGMDKDMKPLGEREVVKITLQDHKHNDVLVDKYRAERKTGAAAAGSPTETFDPYERGTFWGKWLARNPYYQHRALRVYEGFTGDSLESMRCRHYVVDRIDGPSNGSVVITAKDLFALIEIEKAVAPRASRGELDGAISAASTSAPLLPAGIGDLDYPLVGSPGEFYVMIGDEIIRTQRNGDTLQFVTRGAFNTTAAAHSDGDLVQLCLVYQAELAVDISHDLMANYTALGTRTSPSGSSDYINRSEWDSAASELTGLYSAVIATPTPVQELIGELAEQVGFSIWPNLETGMVEFRALRSAAAGATITQEGDILDGSLTVKRLVDQRASEVWVYYAQINPVEDLEDRRNYRSRLVDVNLEYEGEDLYGTPKIRTIFSRWIPQGGRGLAEDTAERLLAMFLDPPVSTEFQMDLDRVDEFEVAGYITLELDEIQDEVGDPDVVQHAVIGMERGENVVTMRTQSVRFEGIVDADDRTIYIENDVSNINLRDIHDLLYAPPVGGSPGEVVTFIIEPDVVVSSTSTGTYALTVGTWPAGVHINVINYGTITGRGGAGGTGGNATTPTAGSAGSVGGPAINATGLPTTGMLDVTNNGTIAGGGGGGGGGGIGSNGDDGGKGCVFTTRVSGSGGGGGRGVSNSSGGSAGGGFVGSPGNVGGGGTLTAPGSGGAQVGTSPRNGAGGNGGAWGSAGSAGAAGASAGNCGQSTSGGAAGPAGNATNGDSKINFLVLGTVHGSRVG